MLINPIPQANQIGDMAIAVSLKVFELEREIARQERHFKACIDIETPPEEFEKIIRKLMKLKDEQKEYKSLLISGSLH